MVAVKGSGLEGEWEEYFGDGEGGIQGVWIGFFGEGEIAAIFPNEAVVGRR